MKILNPIIYALCAFLAFITIQRGCHKPVQSNPIKRVETLKTIIEKVKDSSTANLKIVYRDRIQIHTIEKLVKGDSWPYYIADSAFCDSVIRFMLRANSNLWKQHEFDSAIIITYEQIEKAQDSVITMQDKQVIMAEKKAKKQRTFNRILLGIAGVLGLICITK